MNASNKHPIRGLFLITAAVMGGLFVGQQLNAYLAITITEKTLPEPVSQPSADTFSVLPFRMVDFGGVGIEADSANWGLDYIHNSNRFERVFLAEEPFVDSTAAGEAFAQYRTYLDRMAALGFNAIEISGFLHFIDFERVDGGEAIYSVGSIYRKRHAALRRFYQPFFAYAKQKGFRVILKTDMVAISPPMERYFEQHLGTVDVEQDAFWQVYQQGLEELFERMPLVDGLILRIGEAGAVYNRVGRDYRSELWVRSVPSVKKMLRAFLEVAETYDKYIIFRTWSVGVGEVGRMHTDPAAYERVLGDLDSDRLIVSTKFTKGDFWNHLPLNPTLFSGRHKRIVELQARREFEAFNVIPNYVAPLHQAALTSFLRHNPNIEGVWVWTQSGGPLRHGPMMLYPFHGLWLWTDANVYATARVVQDPSAPVETWTRAWVRETFGEDEGVVEALTELLSMSHATAIQGLTIPSFARKDLKGLGLEVPPVIYSYWDIVGSSTSVTSHVYLVTRGQVDEAVEEAFAAVENVRRMQQLLASVADRVEKGRDWLPWLKASLAYEENLFETMAFHKQFLLKYYEWLDTGGRENKQAWQDALEGYRLAKAVHLERHQGNLSFPAYNFEIADAGVKQADRTDTVIWVARVLLVGLALLLGWLLYRRAAKEEGRWVLIFFSVVLIGLLGAFSSFAAPVFVLTTGLPMLLYFAGLQFLVFRKDEPDRFRAALVPVLILCGLLLAVLSRRGPLYFWLHFWTSDTFRLLLCGTVVPLVLAHFYLVFTAALKTLRRRILTGRLCILVGALLALYGLLYLAVGFEEMLTLLNDELVLLPGMLSRVLGLTTHLNIPLEIPAYLVGAGTLLIVSGAGLVLPRVKQTLGVSPGAYDPPLMRQKGHSS